MEIENTPYAEWLEESVKSILDFKPDSMALVAMHDDGMTLTAYYEAGPKEMSLFVHNIQADFVMELIEQNIASIREMLEKDEDDE